MNGVAVARSNQYQWRLHPSSLARKPLRTPENKSVSKAVNVKNCVGVVVSNAKYSFKLNDDVYIRPKSAKEFGISGRIVDIYDKGNTNTDTIVSSEEASPKRSKKRRLAEDIRVSVQQRRFDLTNDDDVNLYGAIKKGVRPSRLFPVYSVRKDVKERPENSLILLTPDTTNYRQLATSHLHPTDQILEIGCSTGECTALIVRRLLHLNARFRNDGLKQGKIVAFDTGSDMIERAKTRVLSEIDDLMSKNIDESDGKSTTGGSLQSQIVQYHKVDALANPIGAYSHAVNGNDANRKPDVVLIDIGGNRELKGIVRMIQWVQSAFQNGSPRLIIVKSEALVEELSSSVASKEHGTQLGEDPKVATDEVQIMDSGIISHGQEWFSTLLLCLKGGTNDGSNHKPAQSEKTTSTK